MSPEQVEGRAVDHRTDVFSIGVLLYEMATDGRPFAGERSATLMASILKDTPRPVIEVNGKLPRHLGRVISRCLEKGVSDRYQTALDVHRLPAPTSPSAGGLGAEYADWGYGYMSAAGWIEMIYRSLDDGS